ncbi:MAG: cation:proton antiporter [Candidatus Micrarchaeota archaeon]|nr:cation:proton antiporter [Candidatus Micrarchaeota archaeon]
MITVTLLFIIFSSIAFIGFLLNSLFYKIKISAVLPLMLLGLLIGPVFGIIGNGGSSLISELSPYISAFAIAFVLFDVGMNIKASKLKDIILRTTLFTFAFSLVAGFIASGVFYLVFGWGLIISLMAGFALSGTSSIIVPSVIRVAKLSDTLATSLTFEGVLTDIFSLIVPLALFVVLTTGVSPSGIANMFSSFIIGSLSFGVLSAFFWLVILKRFREYSKGYSWMLTLTMVIATYGFAEYVGFNGALSTFIFGIALVNIPDMSPMLRSYTAPIAQEIRHVRSYQREITFFVSTFFFVYLGLLFDIGQITLIAGAIAVALSIFYLLLRYAFTPIRAQTITTGVHSKSETTIAKFFVAKGLSPAIVATLPATVGIAVPNLVNIVFIVIFCTNAMISIGMFLYAMQYVREEKVEKKIEKK